MAIEAMDWELGGEPLPTLMIEARKACKDALESLEKDPTISRNEQPTDGIELEWYCKGWDDAEKDLAPNRECVKGIRHDSDCAVHNSPAYPVGECNCSVVDKKQWVGLSAMDIEEGFKEGWVTKQAFESAVWWAEAKLKEKNT